MLVPVCVLDLCSGRGQVQATAEAEWRKPEDKVAHATVGGGSLFR